MYHRKIRIKKQKSNNKFKNKNNEYRPPRPKPPKRNKRYK